MRIQEIEATQPLQKEFYERDYRTAHGSYDLANLFFELAVRISKEQGDNNIFIFPHKLFNSANGGPLREYLINTRAIKHITHFGANGCFLIIQLDMMFLKNVIRVVLLLVQNLKMFFKVLQLAKMLYTSSNS
jgi:hypothetical protein